MLMARSRPESPWKRKLKALRKNYKPNKLTQREAAELCGVPLRTWICWENGQRIPRGPSLTLLKRTFPQLD